MNGMEGEHADSKFSCRTCHFPPVAAVDGFQNGGWWVVVLAMCSTGLQDNPQRRALQRKLQVAHGTQGSRCFSWQKKARWRQNC